MQSILETHPTYIVDGMLGSTARKLRILGFDTVYDPKSEDGELIRMAAASDRILLTSDTELYFRAKKARTGAILVHGTNEDDRLFQILSKSGVRQIQVHGLISLCSLCNGRLVSTGAKNQNGVEVYSCLSCGRKYWRGSHWKKMAILFNSVNSKLAETSRQNHAG